MTTYLRDAEANLTETLLEDQTNKMLNIVKDGIIKFNETKGRRRGLNPTFVERTPYPGKLYGRILECREDELSEAIPKMAQAVVRTLLRRRTRPILARLSLHEAEGDSKYLIRLALAKN